MPMPAADFAASDMLILQALAICPASGFNTFPWGYVTPYSAAPYEAPAEPDCGCRAAQHGSQACSKAVYGQERTREEVSQDLPAGARSA